MKKFVAGFLTGITTVVLVGILIAALGLWPTHANAVPPRWEVAMARMALSASVARRAPHIPNPVSPNPTNLMQGMKIYKDACAGCHGDPNANSDYGASFYPNVPQFAKVPPRRKDWQLFWIVRNGVRYSGMSAWDRQWHNDEAVSDDHIWKVVTFLTHLESLPPEVDEQWRKGTQ